MSNTIEYRALQEADRDALIEVVMEGLANEPMTVGIGLEEKPMKEMAMEFAIPEVLSHGMTIGAFDTTSGKLVGARCSLLENIDDHYQTKDDMLYDFDTPATRKLAQTEWMYKTLHEGIDLYSTYDTEQVVHFYGLWVKQSYGKRGIGSRLVHEAIEAVKTKGIKCIYTEATNNYSRKIFEKLGFITLKTMDFKDLDVNGENVLTKDMGPHKTISFQVLAL